MTRFDTYDDLNRHTPAKWTGPVARLRSLYVAGTLTRSQYLRALRRLLGGPQ